MAAKGKQAAKVPESVVMCPSCEMEIEDAGDMAAGDEVGCEECGGMFLMMEDGVLVASNGDDDEDDDDYEDDDDDEDDEDDEEDDEDVDGYTFD